MKNFNKYNFIFFVLATIFVFGAEIVTEYQDNSLQIPMRNKTTKETTWVDCKSEAQRFMFGINKEGGIMNLSFLTPLDRSFICIALLVLGYFIWSSKRNGYFKKAHIEVIDNIEFALYFAWIFKTISKVLFNIRIADEVNELDKSYYHGFIFLLAVVFFKLFKEIINNGNELKTETELTI